jgi:hypothetical protein
MRVVQRAEDDSATQEFGQSQAWIFQQDRAESRFLLAFSSHRPMVIVPEVMNWRQNYNWQ